MAGPALLQVSSYGGGKLKPTLVPRDRLKRTPPLEGPEEGRPAIYSGRPVSGDVRRRRPAVPRTGRSAKPPGGGFASYVVFDQRQAGARYVHVRARRASLPGLIEKTTLG